MSEYIITDKQLGLIQDFANVCVEGEKLPRIVRCRDCRHYHIVDEIHGDYDDYPIYGCRLLKFSNARIDDDVQEPQDPDGFCAWAERREP